LKGETATRRDKEGLKVMRPDIGELIQGIKRALAEEVLPAVGSSFAREQLTYTLFVCEHLSQRWDQAHIFAAEEYGDLRATLAAVVEIGRRATASPAEFAAVIDAVAVALASDDGNAARPLRALSAATAELEGAVARLLAACATPPAAEQEACAAVRSTLRGFMKRQLARDEQWVSTAQIGWW
jgi:hypothetical protein